MEIRAGQLIRTTNIEGTNKLFHKVKEYSYEVLTEELDYIPDSWIIKVADTPQELIQVGDALHYKKYHDHNLYDNDLFLITDIRQVKDIDMKYVIKILTPNGKDYICQWEAE